MRLPAMLLVTNFEVMLMAYSGTATRIPASVPHRTGSETEHWDEHLQRALKGTISLNAFLNRKSSFNCQLTYRDYSLRHFVSVTWRRPSLGSHRWVRELLEYRMMVIQVL